MTLIPTYMSTLSPEFHTYLFTFRLIIFVMDMAYFLTKVSTFQLCFTQFSTRRNYPSLFLPTVNSNIGYFIAYTRHFFQDSTGRAVFTIIMALMCSFMSTSRNDWANRMTIGHYIASTCDRGQYFASSTVTRNFFPSYVITW